jgi:hypothetical protein
MNHPMQQGAGVASAPFYSPGTYCPQANIDEVRELTKDWDASRDVGPVFTLVAQAKAYGFKLVKV